MIDRELALYRKLQERGIKIDFITYGDKDDLAFAHTIPGLSIRANVEGLGLGAYERKLLSEPVQADVIKSNQMAGADIAMEVARKSQAQFVARCGYLLAEFQERRYGERSREAKQARKLEEKVFRGADWITVTTTKMAESVVERYKIAPEKIGVIPNYVETDRFRPSDSEQREKLRVGFVGRLDAQKNLHNLITAVVDMDIEVWLIGYGPLQEELERFAEGTVAQFKFLGNVANHELPLMLNQCDIFVMPSLYEGHPKALLEAMACGLPALGTRVPGIQEIITDGENGLLSETGAASLREGLQRLIDDPALRQRLGRAGREYVEAHFALERIVNLEMNLLNRLVG
ncbi:MAG: glycosyltransferase family 4 protein [Anaerolineales bacterium]|nr:MAG: glycosyltransferase family 4 protein [Anaerolineales bacterium]